jgi:phosphoenolpyruvate-protein kinase (PTS system EI component)
MGAAGALDLIESGTTLLLDGTERHDPDRSEPAPSWSRRGPSFSRRQKLQFELDAAVSQPAITPDGVALILMGNVDLPDEIIAAARNDAQGVGLLPHRVPDYRAHLAAHRRRADRLLPARSSDSFPGLPVIIRSFDLGGDKFPAAFRAPQEANPFLGLALHPGLPRSPGIFRPQLRAVLRAAATRKLQLMLAAGDAGWRKLLELQGT